jgi:predicted transcriptional regulator of viral defense system
MLSSGKHKEQALYDLVSGWRRGIFTAEDARQSGYSPQLIAHHVKAGNFVRLARGVYRLSLFPGDHLDGLVGALLRVDPENAVVSHQSALQLHELSEVAPSAYEFTLPREKRYRGSRTRHPHGVKIHTATRLDPQNVVKVGGIRVTTPSRSVVDAGNGGMDLKLVRSAVFDALRKLKASRSQMLEAAERGGEPAVRRAIQEAVADAPSSDQYPDRVPRQQRRNN